MRAFVPGFLLAFGPAFSAIAAPLDVFRDCGDCPEMIELPIGEFLMGPLLHELPYIEHEEGAPRDSAGFVIREQPRSVSVDIRFAMARNETTLEEFMFCVNDGGCRHAPNPEVTGHGGRDQITRSLTDPRFKRIPFETIIVNSESNFAWALTLVGQSPVIDVSYQDVQDYIAWLNRKLGTQAYRLPTEAEWEFAARAGTTTPYTQGVEPTADQVNSSGVQTERLRGAPQTHLRTQGFPVPVNEMDASNHWGLRHMSGNVAEVTLSCYEPDPQLVKIWATTSEWLSKSTRYDCDPILRGGSYLEPIEHSRVTWRRARDASSRDTYIGFRVVKELK